MSAGGEDGVCKGKWRSGGAGKHPGQGDGGAPFPEMFIAGFALAAQWAAAVRAGLRCGYLMWQSELTSEVAPERLQAQRDAGDGKEGPQHVGASPGTKACMAPGLPI